MVVLALLLIAAGMTAAVGLVLGGNLDPVSLDVFGRALPQTSALLVFAAGAGCMLAIGLGVAILRGTARRSMERRREIADLQEIHDESVRRLEDENAHLRHELDRTRDREVSGAGSGVTELRPAPVSELRSDLAMDGDDDHWRDLRDGPGLGAPSRGTGPYSPH